MKSDLDAAIQDCLTIGPVDNWNFPPEYTRDKKIVRKYGESILAEIMAIEKNLNTITPDWQTESWEFFCQRVFDEVKCWYPQLENESVEVLKNRVSYGYK